MYNQKAVKHYQEAQALQDKGSVSSAERAYKKALKITPEFVEAYNGLGNLYLDSLLFDRILQCLI